MKTIFRTMYVAVAVLMAAGCGSSNNKTAEQTTVTEEIIPSVSVIQVSVREVLLRQQDVSAESLLT